MTKFSSILAFPTTDQLRGNDLICEVVEQLDLCGLLVKAIHFGLHQFSLGAPQIYSLIVTIEATSMIGNATEDEKENYLLAQFDMNLKLPDCGIKEIR